MQPATFWLVKTLVEGTATSLEKTTHGYRCRINFASVLISCWVLSSEPWKTWISFMIDFQSVSTHDNRIYVALLLYRLWWRWRREVRQFSTLDKRNLTFNICCAPEMLFALRFFLGSSAEMDWIVFRSTTEYVHLSSRSHLFTKWGLSVDSAVFV